MIKRAVNVILALSGLWLGLSAAHASVQFNGINGYAFASDAATFDFSGSFTIELQFQSSVAQNGSLLAKFHQNSGTALDDSYYILVQNDGSIQCRIQTNLQLVTLTAPGSAFDGNWHHVALVYDHAGGISELYYDGTLGASQPLSGELRDTEEAVRIGVLRSSGVLASFFSGQIDEIRFWNVPRRDVQAGCLRAVTLLLDTPGLISYYRFDETSGTTAFDRIAPLENVTLISGATFVTAEPPFASLLDGPGICQCGDISGTRRGRRYTHAQSTCADRGFQCCGCPRSGGVDFNRNRAELVIYHRTRLTCRRCRHCDRRHRYHAAGLHPGFRVCVAAIGYPQRHQYSEF